MSIRIRSGLAPQWITYESKLPPKEGESVEQPAEEGPPARLFVRPLTELELVDFRNEVYRATDGEIVASGRAVGVALGAVLKWENVLDAEGKALPCVDGNKELLDAKVLTWIAFEVFLLNILQSSEKKTS